MIMPILLIWAIFPDIAAIIIHMLTERVLNVMYNLPYSRSLETEADEVGIKLAAKVCNIITSNFPILKIYIKCSIITICLLLM